MYYWNDKNFEGLKDIGEKYLGVNGYEDFGNYCLLKEKGIKKEAAKAIERFINSANCNSVDEQRTIAIELIILSYYNEDVHQLIPHQLNQFLISIFKNWAEEDSNNIILQRWLGYITRDITYYENALLIDPYDKISIIGLVYAKLNSIDFQTHHLSEALFIGNEKNAKISLKKIAELIIKLEPGEIKDKLYEAYQYFNRLISAWEEYKQKQPTQSFPEWCASKDGNFNFWNIIYYNK